MDFGKNAAGLLVPVENVKHLREQVASILGSGRYHGQLFRKGELIDEWDDKNIVTNEGLNATLNIMLGGGSQLSTWYIGLFTGNYTPVATDTAATIAANSTEATGYTAGARQQFQPAAASAQSISNAASRASFTFNASLTIYGGFLVSSGTINGTSGTLFSAAQFSTPKAVVNLDQMLLTYTFSAASA